MTWIWSDSTALQAAAELWVAGGQAAMTAAMMPADAVAPVSDTSHEDMLYASSGTFTLSVSLSTWKAQLHCTSHSCIVPATAASYLPQLHPTCHNPTTSPETYLH